jgi:raffinose/stachyose/melibiose transport system permease protein
MKNTKELLQKKVMGFVITAVTFFSALLFLFPFYISFAFAFKNYEETSRNPLALPGSLYLDNFINAIKVSNLFHAMGNSAITVILVNAVILVICSMAGYILSRNNKPFYNFIYFIFLSSIMLPFQTVMFPLYRLVYDLKFINSLSGLAICIIGFNAGLFVFLYTGFVKNIPIELEEAAKINGCTKYGAFWRIVFPLLKPINFTVIIIATLNTWNDFSISLILVQKQSVRTLQLAQFYFIGAHYSDPNQAFAAFSIAMIPIIIVFFFSQRYIEKGIVAGALKG